MTNKMDQKHIQLLEENLRRGHLVACKNFDKEWCIFVMYNTESPYPFQGTLAQPSIERSLASGLTSVKYTHQEILEYFTNEYKIVTRPPEQFKQGDLVEIIDTPELRKAAGTFATEECLGKRNRVASQVAGNVAVVPEDNITKFIFPSWAVAKCLPEEPTIQYTDDELIAEVKRRNLLETKEVLK